MKRHVNLISALLLFLLLAAQHLFSQAYTSAHPYSEPKQVQDMLCSEVNYPESALENGIEGEVVISFTVDKDGNVGNVKIAKSVSPEIDAEALRLFRMMLWEPSVSMGQPVESENQYSIDFNIKKYNKHCKERGYTATEFPFQPVDTSNIVYDYMKTDVKPKAVFSEKGMTLGKFIATNIKYPESAFKQNIAGKVTLRYVVEPQGRVSNIKVLNPVGGGCTGEAIRLLQLIKWMPGIKNNMAVRTFMNIDIEFKLPEDSNMNMFENSQMN
jgi:TonB family protein